MCKKCNNSSCIGFYLLHPKEFHKIKTLKDKHLSENANATFALIDSASSGEVFTRFKELHIIY